MAFICPSCTKSPCCCSFHKINESNIGKTLIAKLNPIADRIRNIGVYLGARQYQVSLVWTQWTGGEKGAGEELVLASIDILPTPLLTFDTIDQKTMSFGGQEVGNLTVTEIPPRYTEDLLVGNDIVVGTPGQELPRDVCFYWEVYYPENGHKGNRRRFSVGSPPSKHPTEFQWTIKLARAIADRTREEQPG